MTYDFNTYRNWLKNAQKMNTTPEKALKVIIQGEKSRHTYKQIQSITGHKKEKNSSYTNLDMPQLLYRGHHNDCHIDDQRGN
jgi:hypothetical protein